MSLNLLIGDPDSQWTGDAKKFFESQMYAVTESQNGKDVQLSLYNTEFFAVILNAAIENHSAQNVIRFIKSKHPSLKVILIFNLNTPKETVDEFKKLSLTAYLKKPFSFEDLARELEGQQDIQQVMDNLPTREGQSEEIEVQLEDNKFTKVPIDDLYSTKAVLFDIFIQLGNGHYVKILHKGDTFSQERIDNYKNKKGIEYLYFLTTDRKKYIQFTSHLAAKTAKSQKVSGATKISLLKNAGEKFLEEVCTEGMKPQVVEQGKEICRNITEVVQAQEDLHNLLRAFDEFDPSAVSHSFAVTLFASSVIKQFEWQSTKTIETMALSCMFHDLGKTKLPIELINKRPADMTETELAEYKKHPQFGEELLEGKHGINTTIKQIILQHHEAFDGTGFPAGLKGERIFTLSNILCLANDFVHIMIDKQLKPTEGLRAILTDPKMTARYHSKIIENFIKMFVDPSKMGNKPKTIMPSNSKVFKKSD